MTAEWQIKTVAELQASGALLVEDGNHGENRPRPDEFSTEGIQFIRAADMDGGRVLFESAQRINEVARKRVRKGIGAGGDVLLSHKGTVGKVAYVSTDAPPFVCSPQTTFWRVKDPKQLDRRFIYFYLLSRDFRDQLDSLKGETDMADYVSLTTQRMLKVTVPPLIEQKAIVHILGALDDKIELNRRMNETLEAMARALFKSWFLDFDPVRTKAEGRVPGLPKPLADLFPDRLIKSESGEIPEGWEDASFGSFISQRSERVGVREVVVLSAVASGNLARSDDHFTKRVYSKETNKYLLVEQWDFAYNPSRINIGSIGMLEENILGGVSPVYVVVRPKTAYRWFLEFSIRRASTKTWINTLASGSVRQSLSFTDFASIPCVIPPEAVAQEFDRRWSILREGIQLREAESRTLASIRDALLPKLISGALRVKVAA